MTSGLKSGLAQLFDAIVERAPDVMWLRLMYAYPTQLTPAMIETMARHPQIASYIDIPLQHAHPEMLRRMKRPNDVERNRRLIGQLREAMPDIAIRTTFIVGFPARRTRSSRRCSTSWMRCSSTTWGCSPIRPKRARPQPICPTRYRRRSRPKRYREAMLRQQKISAAKNRRLIGSTMDVLIDGTGTLEDGKGRQVPIYAGRTYRQAPEVDGMVFVKAPKG